MVRAREGAESKGRSLYIWAVITHSSHGSHLLHLVMVVKPMIFVYYYVYEAMDAHMIKKA